MVPKAEQRRVKHVSRLELLQLLRGKGKKRAKWLSALEVMQAKRYVEQYAEHLLDFSLWKDQPPERLRNLVNEIYEES